MSAASSSISAQVAEPVLELSERPETPHEVEKKDEQDGVRGCEDTESSR